MAKQKKFDYTASVEKLEQLVQELEEGKVPFDKLSEKVEEGLQLMQACRAYLRETENKIDQAFTSDDEPQ